MKRIDFCLWFDRQAEANMNFGVSPFGNARLCGLPRGDDGHKQCQQQAARDEEADRLHTAVAT